ncbi:MAG: hypothetical protein HY901_21830 [Deltaproteobacteria bacterium]|nr:hypothetical protein [Deltaproteobacteria bacterium]
MPKPSSAAMTRVLARFKRTDTTSFEDAWVGMEPTFQSEKSIKKWQKMAAEDGGEDAYFEDEYMLETQKDVAKAMVKRFKGALDKKEDWRCFAAVDREEDADPWKVKRQNLHFRWDDKALGDFEIKLGLDPETFEYSIKPVPVAWFYDERWVRFLEEIVWGAPLSQGLAPTIAHGGCQFSVSAKTFLTGSLLADDIADKLNHPELSTWIMDWPNPDDRAFRATTRRFAAFRSVLDSYWAGGFHPQAKGALTAESCFLDRGFGPVPAPPPGMMDPKEGPLGEARDVFQTNFGFGRAVRLQAQIVHPGYWQAAHPAEEGYRADQIMRYGEGNLNRLQIAGEWHVKSGKPLEVQRAPAPEQILDSSMLATEASWENRAQMGRTSARDFVEAMLLYLHRARWLAAHPHPTVKATLLQDQLLGGAEETLKKHAPKALERLRQEARKLNLDSSRGRLKSEWIEPETLQWTAWKALPAGERGAVAREVVTRFVEYVEEAASCDPRTKRGDPLEWHRHRIHPSLWKAILDARIELKPEVRREMETFQERRKELLARRPVFSLAGLQPPWEG